MILPSRFFDPHSGRGDDPGAARGVQIVELVFLLLPLRDVLFQERQQIIVKEYRFLSARALKRTNISSSRSFGNLNPDVSAGSPGVTAAARR